MVITGLFDIYFALNATKQIEFKEKASEKLSKLINFYRIQVRFYFFAVLLDVVRHQHH